MIGVLYWVLLDKAVKSYYSLMVRGKKWNRFNAARSFGCGLILAREKNCYSGDPLEEWRTEHETEL